MSSPVGTGCLQGIHPAPWKFVTRNAFSGGGGADRQVKEVGRIIFPGSKELNFQETILEYCISDDDDGHKHMLS